MADDSTSKRITRGIILHDKFSIDDLPSFSLGITQEGEHIAGSIARERDSVEIRSKRKRKDGDMGSGSGEARKKGDGSDIGKQKESEEDNQVVHYFMEGNPSVIQHTQCYTNTNVMDDLSNMLTKNQLRRFRETTCFSHLLDVNQLTVQAQIFRAFMMFEVHGSSCDAFVIHVNGSTLRFTRRDFSIISVLKCGDETSNFVFNTEEPNRIILQYFGDQNRSVTKQQLIATCMDRAWGDNDEDALKFATLYFIHNFIMSEEPSSTIVPRKHFDLVESGRHAEYPWGNEAFGELLKNLHAKITLTGKYYRIHGFPLAMQVWIYECCSHVNPKIAVKVSNHIPRIRNWVTTTDKPRCDFLINSLFQGTRKQVVLKNMTATEQEITSIELPPEHIVSDSVHRGVQSDDDFQEPPTTRKNKGKEKVVDRASPARKKLRTSATKVSKKSPEKRQPRHPRVSVSPQADAAKKTQTRRQMERKKTKDTFLKPSSSRTNEQSISRDEFESFKQFVREEFVELKMMVQDNFKEILKEMRSNKNDLKVDVEHSPVHDTEQVPHEVSSTDNSHEVERASPAKSQFPFGDTSRIQQSIYVDSGGPENQGVESRVDSHVLEKDQSNAQAETACKETADKEFHGEEAQAGITEMDATPMPTAKDSSHAPDPDNREDVVGNTETADSNLGVDEELSKGNSNQAQVLSESQFELPDELLPSLNTVNLNNERSIVVHPLAYIDTPPLEIVETPVPARRPRRPGPYNVSPYMASFGSEAGASSSSRGKIFTQKHPFNSIQGTQDTSLYRILWDWLSVGLLARHQNKKQGEDHYRKNKAVFHPPIDLGVATISNKNWFYNLATVGQVIDDSHIDVIMYYLRKKSKYSMRNTYRFTTVDCNFSALMHRIWAAYADHENGECNANSERTVRAYINGFRLQAAVPWHTVDNVFIPVNMNEKFHWVLIVVCFTKRTIYIYDSIRSVVHDVFVTKEVSKYAELLPTYLATEDFYEKKGLDVHEHPSYKLHSEYDPFDIVHVNNIPLQPEGSLECGVYLAAFAEFLSDGNDITVTSFDSEQMRIRYAALLWDYGTRKLQQDSISDNEAPPKQNRMAGGNVGEGIEV